MATYGYRVFAALACVGSTFLGSACYSQTADGLTLTSQEKQSANEVLTRLDRTERLLEQTQQELQDLRDRDSDRYNGEQSATDGSDFQFITLGKLKSHYNGDDFPCFHDCCVECEQEEQDESVVADLAEALVPVATDCGNITFKPGVRIQTRYLYDDRTNNHDIFIRRFRLKGSGDVYGLAKWGTELKIDSTARINTDPSPLGVVENAWLDFNVFGDLTYLRVGLYDAPFSRNALTSDSKLLFMDRTLIKGALTNLGFTDNTVGMMFHGRPQKGRYEYMIGLFDDVRFEQFNFVGGIGNGIDPVIARNTDKLMTAGRFVVNLLDPQIPPQGYADYRGSYIGEGSRLAVGTNFAYVGDTTFDVTAVPTTDFDVYAWGVDVFFNNGPWVAQAEYDWFKEDATNGGADVEGDGWYAQAGYLLNHRQYQCCECKCGYEIAARYEESDRLRLVDGTIDDRFDWVSIGMNIYVRDHNFKLQTDYTFRSEDIVKVDNDVYQLQLQFDY